MVFGLFYFREGDFIKTLIPINLSFDKDILVHFLGLLIPLLLFGFTIISSTNQILNPQIIAPLAQFSTQNSIETFAAVKAVADPFTYGFIVIYFASIFEELILGMVFLLVGVFATDLIIRLSGGYSKRKLSSTSRNRILFIGGMFLSMLFFVILHSFNNTYVNNPILFLYAGIFRFVLNLVIYKFFALGIAFSQSFHMSWNAMSLGWVSLKAFILTPGGMILILIEVALLIYGIMRLPKLGVEFWKIVTFRSKLLS